MDYCALQRGKSRAGGKEEAPNPDSHLHFNRLSTDLCHFLMFSSFSCCRFHSTLCFFTCLSIVWFSCLEPPVPPAHLHAAGGRNFVFTVHFLVLGCHTVPWSTITAPKVWRPLIYPHQYVPVGALCTSLGRRAGERQFHHRRAKKNLRADIKATSLTPLTLMPTVAALPPA
jgi:hypothetical protein